MPTQRIQVSNTIRSNQDSSENESPGRVSYVALFFSGLLMLIFPIIIPCCFKVIHTYERAIIFRLGRVQGQRVLKPGLVFVFPCVDELVVRDIRTKCYATPQQKLLTKDSVNITIDAALTFSVKDARSVLVNRINLDRITKIHALTALRDICGNLTLSEVVHGRELVSKQGKKALQRKWSRSLDIKSLDIKNIELPTSMVTSMASEALSTRESKAKVIRAEGEVRASRALKEAAIVIDTSPASIHLRYLQTMTAVAKSKNHTLIFPMPEQLIGMVKHIIGGKRKTT